MPLRGEFIGRHVAVKNCDINGIIIDETKNSFVIETSKGEKTLLKTNNTFQIRTRENTITVEGNQIQQRPEDRIKQKWK